MEVFIKEEWATPNETWKQWREAAIEGTVGKAHQFARAPDLHKYKMAKGAVGVMRCSVADQLAEEVKKWAQLWVVPGKDEAQSKPAAEWITPDWAVVMLSTEAIRKSSRSFVQKTKVTGWHPRHFKDLRDPVMDCLASVYHVFEAGVHWATDQQSLVVRLMQKTDGDRRPISGGRSASLEGGQHG